MSSLALTAAPGSAQPTKPVADKPTITEVKARLDKLDREAEVASEALNAARVELKQASQRLSALQSDVKRQQSTVDALRRQVIGSELAKYQTSSGLSTATEFLVADDPQSFLNNLADSVVQDHVEAGIVSRLVQEQDQLSIRQKQASVEVDAISADKSAISKHAAELKDKTAEAQDLLDSLEAAQLAAIQAMNAAPTTTTTTTGGTETPSRGSDPRVPPSDVPTSDRAAVAVQVALDQLGDPYVYGAAGPDSFDCSGLTMYAWGKAGVSLPHASSAQPSYGTQVSLSDLMPGDLIFYYSPISHVAMYIGHGQIVHAPHTGDVVRIASMYEMPIAEAVRVG